MVDCWVVVYQLVLLCGCFAGCVGWVFSLVCLDLFMVVVFCDLKLFACFDFGLRWFVFGCCCLVVVCCYDYGVVLDYDLGLASLGLFVLVLLACLVCGLLLYLCLFSCLFMIVVLWWVLVLCLWFVIQLVCLELRPVLLFGVWWIGFAICVIWLFG